MTCWSVNRRTTDYVDGRLRGADLARVETHLRHCAKCEIRLQDLGSIRSSLQELPKAQSPASLRTHLRVIASQERKLILEADGSRLLLLWNEWKFRMQELMRPFTIPATGGLCSSLLLFGALAFTIGTTTRGVAYEVPLMYSSQFEANLLPIELRSSMVLTLSLDANGRITDFAFHNGSHSVQGDPATLQHHNIAVPEFPTVMALATPVSSDIQISVTPMVFRR
jgi:Putative zinc-finger